MNVADTSLEAYNKVKANLSKRQRDVLAIVEKLVLEKGWTDGVNNKAIAENSTLAINQVTPRTGELRSEGVLVDLEVRECPYSGNESQFFTLNTRDRGGVENE